MSAPSSCAPTTPAKIKVTKGTEVQILDEYEPCYWGNNHCELYLDPGVCWELTWIGSPSEQKSGDSQYGTYSGGSVCSEFVP